MKKYINFSNMKLEPSVYLRKVKFNKLYLVGLFLDSAIQIDTEYEDLILDVIRTNSWRIAANKYSRIHGKKSARQIKSLEYVLTVHSILVR